MSKDFPKVKVGNLGYQEDITTATLKNQPEPEKIHLEKEKHLEIINFGVPCLFFQVWDHPDPCDIEKDRHEALLLDVAQDVPNLQTLAANVDRLVTEGEKESNIFWSMPSMLRLIEWRIDWMKDWMFMDNFPYEWTWHHILCEVCEWARRHVAMCCVRSYHYISIARVSKNATAFIEAFLLSWQAGCLEVERSSESSKWFLLWWETDLDMNFPQNSVSEGKKPLISNINFQHKFLNLSLLPYYNSFRQTESLLQTWTLLRGLRENQPLQAWHGSNQPMGKAGHKNFWKITNWNPKKNGGEWFRQFFFLCNLLPCWFSGRYMPKVFRFHVKNFPWGVHAQGFYLPTNGPLNLVNPSMPGMPGVSPWQQERCFTPFPFLGSWWKIPQVWGVFRDNLKLSSVWGISGFPLNSEVGVGLVV